MHNAWTCIVAVTGREWVFDKFLKFASPLKVQMNNLMLQIINIKYHFRILFKN